MPHAPMDGTRLLECESTILDLFNNILAEMRKSRINSHNYIKYSYERIERKQ